MVLVGVFVFPGVSRSTTRPAALSVTRVARGLCHSSVRRPHSDDSDCGACRDNRSYSVVRPLAAPVPAQAAAVLIAALASWTVALTQQYFLQIPEDATIFAGESLG